MSGVDLEFRPLMKITLEILPKKWLNMKILVKIVFFSLVRGAH